MEISLLAPDADGGADFLTIDDLLDFSNDEIGGPIGAEAASAAAATPIASSAPSAAQASMASSQESSPLLPPPASFDSDKLCVPDLAELEWLSNFVEESFSSASSDTTAGFCLGDWKQQKRENGEGAIEAAGTATASVRDSSAQSSGGDPASFTPQSAMAAPAAARSRSKRGRAAVCFWNTRIFSEASESILESSSTASTIASDSDMINDAFYDHDDDDDDYNENEDGDGADEEEEDDDDNDDDDDIMDDIMDARIRLYSHHQRRRYVSHNATFRLKKFNKGMPSIVAKKLKKSKVQGSMARSMDVVRKCLHCATQKTPQWRAGPMGPKTLCNACGVRYKSGRLCAEYRPASSPTFVETVHSNSHKKVLEMRKQRGELGSTNPSSFLGKSLQCHQGHPS